MFNKIVLGLLQTKMCITPDEIDIYNKFLFKASFKKISNYP